MLQDLQVRHGRLRFEFGDIDLVLFDPVPQASFLDTQDGRRFDLNTTGLPKRINDHPAFKIFDTQIQIHFAIVDVLDRFIRVKRDS